MWLVHNFFKGEIHDFCLTQRVCFCWFLWRLYQNISNKLNLVKRVTYATQNTQQSYVLSSFNLLLNKLLQLWIKWFSSHRQQEEQHLHIFHPLIHSFKKYLFIITFKWFFNFRTLSLIIYWLYMRRKQTISSCIHSNKSFVFFFFNTLWQFPYWAI